ncbi:hypothetical protein DOY81_015326, partial [Sarcophaga bullata]
NFEARWHATMMLHSWNVIRILVLLSIVLVLDEPNTKVYNVPSLRVYVKKLVWLRMPLKPLCKS